MAVSGVLLIIIKVRHNYENFVRILNDNFNLYYKFFYFFSYKTYSCFLFY